MLPSPLELANTASEFLVVTEYIIIPQLAITLMIIPKDLRAESARAVTGRRCPHSREGEDFLRGQPGSFYEKGCNSGTESRKIVPKVGN